MYEHNASRLPTCLDEQLCALDVTCLHSHCQGGLVKRLDHFTLEHPVARAVLAADEKDTGTPFI